MTTWYRDWQDEFTTSRKSKVKTSYSLVAWNMQRQLPELIVDHFGSGDIENYKWDGWVRVKEPIEGYCTDSSHRVTNLAEQFRDNGRMTAEFVSRFIDSICEIENQGYPIRYFVERI